MPPAWICCQVGAREHFAIARALHEAKRLALLITDTWIGPRHWLGHLTSIGCTKLRQRFHPALASAAVSAFPVSALLFEGTQRLQRRNGWDRIIARNIWFQKHVLNALADFRWFPEERPTVFAYSYAALDIFHYAKSRGWRTVLGQIDPGPVEEDLVAHEQSRHAEYLTNWRPAPARYWRAWEDECALADCIMVNSGWSKRALQQVGIDQEKIAVVPLAYEPPPAAQHYRRRYPDSFTRDRPLRVLFLGQIILRKGIAAVLAAARRLGKSPVEFWLVGSTELVQLPESPNVRWVGPVSRDETARYYREADVFLFPTISDGFGLTQLEAQAWKLPVIASRACGDVVKDRLNGFVLPEVTGDAIASALSECLLRPWLLADLAREAERMADRYGLSVLRHNLERLDHLPAGGPRPSTVPADGCSAWDHRLA